MRFFQNLGDKIEKRFREANFNESRFTEIATEALEAMPPSKTVDPTDVIDWVLSASTLPNQFDLRSSFGQPPITVYARDRFHIDVLFWLDSTTSIHSHGFGGAFHVLAGSSIHTTWSWKPRERLNALLALGQLQ